MANRHILHLSKLDAFAEWAATKGIERLPTKGYYEALRLRQEKAPRILRYCRRLSGDHATFPDSSAEERLVRRWLRERDA